MSLFSDYFHNDWNEIVSLRKCYVTNLWAYTEPTADQIITQWLSTLRQNDLKSSIFFLALWHSMKVKVIKTGVKM